MKKSKQNQQLDNLIGQKLAESFGYSDEQLIAEFDRVAAEPEDPENPEPEAPTDTFEKILARMDAEDKSKRKVIRIERTAKVMILVAALAVAVLSTGVAASGKRGFKYSAREAGVGNEWVVWNNTGNFEVQGSEEGAYQRIGEELGINVLQIMDKPKGMRFKQLEIYRGYARMEFVYEDQYTYLTQTQRSVEHSIGAASDLEEDIKVFNRQLKQDLVIKKNTLENGDIEFSTEFVYEKAGYRLAGIMEEQEFKEMVKKVAFLD